MIDEKRYSQYGEPGLVPKGIVLHGTDTNQTARDIFNYLNGECKDSKSTHFLVDSEEIIEVMPLDWKVWSTGTYKDWAFHNCIVIDICSNINDAIYLIGLRKAVELMKSLMATYNLTTNDIYFHNDFNSHIYCPSDLLRIYGNKRKFIMEEFK